MSQNNRVEHCQVCIGNNWDFVYRPPVKLGALVTIDSLIERQLVVVRKSFPSSRPSPSFINECPDCGALPGAYHQLGCDIERCPYCFWQMLEHIFGGGCPVHEDTPWPVPQEDRLLWTGVWPGEQECLDFGWYDANGIPDLTRLYTDAVWDRVLRRFIRRDEATSSPSDLSSIVVERMRSLRSRREKRSTA